MDHAQMNILCSKMDLTSREKSISVPSLWKLLIEIYYPDSPPGKMNSGQHLYRIFNCTQNDIQIKTLYRIAHLMKCPIDFGLGADELYEYEPVALALNLANSKLSLEKSNPDDYIFEIAKQINKQRKFIGLSQVELSKKANISRTTLSDIENPKKLGAVKDINLSTLIKINNALRSKP
jgi:transcriptional regulator with XRE-family HTH domain